MINNKQQTPVEWQHIELSKFLNGKSEFTDAHDILIKAKEMEKAEKIKFATDFFFWWYNQTSGTNTCEAVEKFYEQTYKGGKQ